MFQSRYIFVYNKFDTTLEKLPNKFNVQSFACITFAKTLVENVHYLKLAMTGVKVQKREELGRAHSQSLKLK